jgi:CheY-like chemotaxis protein
MVFSGEVGVVSRSAGPRRVVVACFPPEESETLVSAIRSEDCDVESADDATRAIGLCLALSPDVLVCDISTPDIEGLHVLATLSQYGRHPKIICYAGGGEDSSMVPLAMADFYGARAVLHKPIDAGDFKDAMGSLLA